MWLLALVALVVAAGGLVQSVTGFGFALLVMPVLAVAMGPKTAVVVMTAASAPLSLLNAVRWRADIRAREAVTVTVAALVGMPLGAIVLTRAGDRALTLLIGLAVLTMTAWLWRGLRLPTGRATELTAGVVSGALSTSVGTSGPPLVIAFQATGMDPLPFRATLAVVFAVESLLALVTFWVTGHLTAEAGPAALVGWPAVTAGALAGDRLFAGMDRGRFRAVVLATLALSGVLAVLGAFAG